MTNLKWIMDLLPIEYEAMPTGKCVCGLNLYVRAIKTTNPTSMSYTTTFSNSTPTDLMDHLPKEIFTDLERAFAQYVVSNITKTGLTEATLKLEDEISKANLNLEEWVK